MKQFLVLLVFTLGEELNNTQAQTQIKRHVHANLVSVLQLTL